MNKNIKVPVSKDGIAPKEDPAVPVEGAEQKKEESTKPTDPTEPTPPSEPTPTEELVSIDGAEYKVDKDGNALKDDGSVFMTKEELDKLESGDDGEGDDSDDPEIEVSIDDIEKASGIELKDKEGKKIQFPFTLEGLAQREKMIKDVSLNQGKNLAIEEYFKANPDLYKAHIYKQKKGTLEGFTNQPYYKTIQVDKDNEQQLKQLVIEAEIRRGKSPEAAKRYAEYCKAENILDEEGLNAHKLLIELEEKEEKSYTSNIEQTRKAQLEQEKKYYGTYYDESGKEVIVDTPGSIYNKVVTKGQFGNLVIPQEGIPIKTKEGNITRISRRQIFDYVATPVEGDKFNRSQAQIDLDTKFGDIDYKLRQYMMNLTGNDLSVFLERQMLESKSKNIKRTLKTSSTSSNADISKETGKRVLKVPVK